MKINLKKILIALSLLVLWFGLTMWYILIIDKSFLVYSFPHSSSSIRDLNSKPIVKGKVIYGEIKAIENGLGIVTLRFKSSKRIPYKDEDLLEFRIKEKGERGWYYVNQYRSGFIYDLPALPFGFPLINDSKGKIYSFELESLKGNSKNAVVISNRSPVVLSKYQQEKQVVLGNISSSAEFLFKKFYNSIKIVDIYFSSIVYLLPLLFYFYWSLKYGENKIIKNKKYIFKWNLNISIIFKNIIYICRMFTLIPILIALVLIDVFLLQILNDFLYITIGALWIILIRKYLVPNSISMLTALGLLLISSIFMQIGAQVPSEKAATWAFTFLVVWFIQSILPVIEVNKLSR